MVFQGESRGEFTSSLKHRDDKPEMICNSSAKYSTLSFPVKTTIAKNEEM